MQVTVPGTLESRMRGNLHVRFGGGLSEKGGNAPRREPTQPFKRAAAKFGVARYLYRDGVPSFVREREPGVEAEPIPAASAPAPTARANGSTPRTGKALFAWVKEMEQRHEVGLLKYLNGWAKLQDFPGRMIDWDADQVSSAYGEAVRKLQTIQPARNESYEEALSN